MTINSIDKHHKPIMEQKKPITKIILIDFICIKFKNQETNFWC